MITLKNIFRYKTALIVACIICISVIIFIKKTSTLKCEKVNYVVMPNTFGDYVIIGKCSNTNNRILIQKHFDNKSQALEFAKDLNEYENINNINL
jgi:hypothetical protein